MTESHFSTPKQNAPSAVAGEVAAGLLELLNHIDSENSSRSNVIVGFGSAVLALIVPRFQDFSDGSFWTATGFVAFVCATLVAIINAIITLKPPGYSSKGFLNLLYPGSYLRQLSQDEYVEELTKLFSNDTAIMGALAKELYVYGGTVMTQAKRLEFSIKVLTAGIVFGVIFQIVGWIV